MPRLSDQELAALLAAASKGPWSIWPELEPAAWKELEEKGVFDALLFDTEGNIAEFDAYDLVQNRANARLAALAPALAQEVLDQRKAGQAMAEALERIQITTQEESLEALCAIALAHWAEMAETEVQDAK